MQAINRVSKRLRKKIALYIAKVLLHLDLNDVELLDDKVLVNEPRAALLVKVGGSSKDAYVLHIEIRNENQAELPWQMLRNRAEFVTTYPGLPIQQCVLYIGNSPLNMPSEIEEDYLLYRFQIVDLHAQVADELLALGSPQSSVLAILGDFHGLPANLMIRRILMQLSKLLSTDPDAFNDCMAILDVLADIRQLQNVFREEATLLRTGTPLDVSPDLALSE